MPEELQQFALPPSVYESAYFLTASECVVIFFASLIGEKWCLCTFFLTLPFQELECAGTSFHA